MKGKEKGKPEIERKGIKRQEKQKEKGKTEYERKAVIGKLGRMA